MEKLEGAYALVLINDSDPSEMIGIKFGSPLVLAKGKDGSFFLASDVNSIAEHSSNIIYLEDGDIVHIKDGKFVIRQSGALVERSHEKIDVSQIRLDKGKFEHFMLKEIHEVPDVLVDVFR